MISQLLNSGYKQVSQVLKQGEFSIRGDILDIFERSSQMPFRVEFFGDEVDGIRLFNPENQISIQNVEHVHIHPATDIIFTKADYKSAQKKIENLIEKRLNMLILENYCLIFIKMNGQFLIIFQNIAQFSLMIFKKL